ncbi:MAG: DUF423 domain-containing protein [Cytophagia bacterium]|nr:MAG: DUF423 domain-containing protein [Cytophagales bacterium]TAG00866.1 MAG: DUF423 domain-containing protein [Cytophagia bacterium]TAG43427.1 MAG: DUF423 domain-containing protein [Cytophagia bacterium]TAH29344.1 MAG: DUF423 domain-containing protein [Cytophagales bacterium]
MKIFIFLGSLLGGLAVALGAFGAHALKDVLVANARLDTYELAVKYQFYHALLLIIIGILGVYLPEKWLYYAGYSIIGGIFIFSGSLYILALTNIKWLGAITPIGGLLFLIGWGILIFLSAK